MKKTKTRMILALSAVGAEYCYKISTAHAVSRRSADNIAARLNAIGYQHMDGWIWYAHEIDEYDRAYDFAGMQKFTIYRNMIKDVKS